jgi:DnaJ-class molecular chaperone
MNKETERPPCFDTGVKDPQAERCDECPWYDVCDNPELRDDEDWGICAQCNGSGEGQYDGTRCGRCKGSGTDRRGGQTPEDWDDFRRDEDDYRTDRV